MSEQLKKQNSIREKFYMSSQTAGDKCQVYPLNGQDEPLKRTLSRPMKIRTSGEDKGDIETKLTASQTKSMDIAGAPESTNVEKADKQQEDNTEDIDISLTHADDHLPIQRSLASDQQDRVILTKDKMVQVPEAEASEDELEDTIVEKTMTIPKVIAVPMNEHETGGLQLSLYNDKGFRESFPSVKPDPNEENATEQECCGTYREACCITFSCGIPLFMKQRKARRDNTVTINHLDIDLKEHFEEEKPVQPIIQKVEDDKEDLRSNSFLNVFFLIITCGISGLLRKMQRQPTPVIPPPAPISEEVQTLPEVIASDTAPLITSPTTVESTSTFTDKLCLIATCGFSRHSRQPSESPTPQAKAEAPEVFYTNIDDVTDDAVKPPEVIVVAASVGTNVPIVTFSKSKEAVLQDIAPILYKSISQYDPDDRSIKSASSCCLSCMNVCCQTCSCDLTRTFSRNRKNNAPHTKKEELFTPNLQKASIEGVKSLKKIVFPLVRDVAREVWVSLELATILIALILSIATVSFNQNEVFNILHLILIIISSALAIVDAMYSLLKCQSCKTCYKYLKRGDESSDKGGEKQQPTKTCLKCLYWCNNKLDIARIFVTEVLAYPLLVCDIFEVIVGRVHEGKSHNDRLGFALFLLSCISLLLYVYIVRVMVLGRSIKHLQEFRTLEVRSNKESDKIGYVAIKEAFKYQICFFVHVVLQMLAQIMMLIAIGGKIRYDNRHFYEPGNTNESIHYSGYLIIMLIIGYITPTLGYLSFFIVTKTWATEFPLGVFNDLVCQLKFLKTGCPDDFLTDDDELNKEQEDKLNKGNHGLPFKKLSKEQKIERFKQFMAKFKGDFEKLRNNTFFSKLESPFKTPWIILLCLLYSAMQLTFIVCAGVAVDDMGVVASQILNGGGWVAYYIFAIIFGAIANAYVFLVVAFWVLVVVAILAVIAGILLCFILVCMIVICASSSSNNNRNRHQYYQ